MATSIRCAVIGMVAVLLLAGCGSSTLTIGGVTMTPDQYRAELTDAWEAGDGARLTELGCLASEFDAMGNAVSFSPNAYKVMMNMSDADLVKLFKALENQE